MWSIFRNPNAYFPWNFLPSPSVLRQTDGDLPRKRSFSKKFRIHTDWIHSPEYVLFSVPVGLEIFMSKPRSQPTMTSDRRPIDLSSPNYIARLSPSRDARPIELDGDVGERVFFFLRREVEPPPSGGDMAQVVDGLNPCCCNISTQNGLSRIQPSRCHAQVAIQTAIRCRKR